jgi:class 3 adenylate cyclase
MTGADILPLAIGTCFFLILYCASVVIVCRMLTSQTVEVGTVSPHIVHLSRTYTYMLLGVMSVYRLVLGRTKTPIYLNDSLASLDEIINTFHLSEVSYDYLLFGGTDGLPFAGLSKGLDFARSTMDCSMNFAPSNLVEAVSCFTPGMTLAFLQPLFVRRLLLVQQGHLEELNPADATYDFVWHTLISPLYSDLIEPLSESLIPDLQDNLSRIETSALWPVLIMFVCILLIDSMLWVQLSTITTHIRTVLKLLLHFHPDIISSSARVMKVLSGNFSAAKSDSMNRDAEFFEAVFEHLPGPAMHANSEMLIEGVNAASRRVFGDTPMEGVHLLQFFKPGTFAGNAKDLFTGSGTMTVETLVFRGNVHLEVTAFLTGGKYVVSCRDVSEKVACERQIHEERANYHKLLAAIMPLQVIQRMHDDRENVSFSVQMSTVIFVNVVRFSDILDTLPAATTLSILNQLWAALDGIITGLRMMTKVKTYGDCYLTAGGLFSESHHSELTHAVEGVTFGLQAIAATAKLNTERETNFKLRVGAHIGGPIVAGVFGISKPAFEIFGGTINVAKMMEQIGIPMSVVVSRQVYERLYGTFKMRENLRDVNGETVESYIILDKPGA